LPDEIKIHAHLDENPLPIVGGAAQLLRVFSNVLINSMEAMPEGGVLTVISERTSTHPPHPKAGKEGEAEYVRITIRDEGIGIPDELQPRVFEPFFTTKQVKRQRGHGLGLSVVHGVVEDHKGFVSLSSRQGEGTSFCLHFPLCREPIEDEAPAATVHGTEHVLVVDDDVLQTDVFTRILTSLGYRVDGVNSGEDAVQYLRDHTADLILLDVVMENGIDGVETFRRIKTFRPAQKVIFVSGYAEAAMVAVARRLGAGPVMRKPVTTELLANTIRNELDRGR